MVSEQKREEINNELKEYALQHGFELLEDYVDSKTPIKCRCFAHGHIFYKDSCNLRRSKGCPKCMKEYYSEYINSKLPCVWETHPKIAENLLNPDDGYKYSHGSGMIFAFVCPYCGNIIYRRMCDAVNEGIPCSRCSSGKSYPNKLMYQIMTQLNIDFINEYSADWTNGKLYDFYFCHNGQQYIVEMDGEFHFSSIYNDVEDAIENDNYKDFMAASKGIKMIRINCKYGRMSNRLSHIKSNILSSELASIFDLSNIDFDKCDAIACMPIMKTISDLWNNGVQVLEDLSNMVHIVDRGRITIHLVNASRIGLIKETEEEVHYILRKNGLEIARKKQIEIKSNRGKPLIIEQTGEVFRNPSIAKKHYPSLKGIYDNLIGKIHFAGIINGQKVNCEYITLDEYNEYLGNENN